MKWTKIKYNSFIAGLKESLIEAAQEINQETRNMAYEVAISALDDDKDLELFMRTTLNVSDCAGRLADDIC